MHAEPVSDYSLKIFTTISFILVKHKCTMKDMDMETGIFTIGGNTEQSILNCESDIYEYIYSTHQGGAM